METSNAVEIMWEIRDVGKVARLDTFFKCGTTCTFQGWKEEIRLILIFGSSEQLMNSPKFFFGLNGTPSCGHIQKEVSFDIQVITVSGEKRQITSKQSKAFKRDDRKARVLLFSGEELLDKKRGLLVGDSVRLCVNLTKSGHPASSPTTGYARSNLGTQRIVTCTVNQILALNTGMNIKFPFKELCKDKNSSTCLVIFLSNGKVAIRCTTTEKFFKSGVLIKFVSIRGKYEDIIWEGKQCLKANDLRDNISLVSKQEIVNNSDFYLLDDDLTLSVRLIDYTTPTANLVKTVLQGNLPLSKKTIQISTSEKVTCTASLPSGSASYKSTQSRSFGVNIDSNSNSDHHSTLLESNLQTLLEKETFSDFTLKVQSESIPVHKAILCARSPVFEAMLTSSMLESSQKSVDVPDFSPDTVRRLVRYLYSGSFVGLDPISALELYSAADKYAVLALRDECSHVLESGLSVENVCHVLSLSDRHSDIGPEAKRPRLHPGT